MLLAWLLAPPYHHSKTASKYDCILLHLPETWCPLCQHDFVPYTLYEMWNIINKIDYLTLKKNVALLLSPNKFIALWFVGLWSQTFALTLKPTWERFIIIVLLSWLSLRYLSRQWKNKRLAISNLFLTPLSLLKGCGWLFLVKRGSVVLETDNKVVFAFILKAVPHI